METILAITVGLIIGAAFGGLLAWLAMRLRAGSAGADLRAELDAANNELAVANKRITDAESAVSEHKRSAEEYRQKAADGDVQIAKLNTAFEASQERYAALEQTNAELRDANERAQRQTAANAAEVADLKAQLDAANKRLAEHVQTHADLTAANAEAQSDNTRIAAENADLSAKLDAANKRLAEQTDIEKTLLDQFKVMASDALKSNNDQFIKAADAKIGALVTQANKDFSISKDAVNELVKPLSDELKRIEEARNKSQGSLTEQIKALQENNSSLVAETRGLATALKRPEVRGSWGEMQLRRVVELAGMQDYCDYEEQVTVTADDGSRDRPDMVVRMPNNRTIVVDAKAPMNAYLTAVESDTADARQDAIRRHSQQVRARAQNLSQKAYQQIFERSPDFVVMFLPGEYLLSAALETDRDLIDWAMQRNVIIATPNTLMALLKAVAMGWREAQIEEEAAKVAALGQELHDRIRVFAGHMSRMGSSLDGAVKAFNSGVGSLESRVLTSARRFSEYGVAANQDIPELSEIATPPRAFRSAELRALPEPAAAGDD